MTYSEALREALIEEMRATTRVRHGRGRRRLGPRRRRLPVTEGLVEEFGPERVRDTPLSEAGSSGVAVGAAVTGLRPVAEIMYIDFMTLAMDQIVNQAAKMRYMFGGKATVPLVVRTQGGAGRGNAAQHSQSLEAWFVHVPGSRSSCRPRPTDAKGLLKAAIRDDNPVIFIEHKTLYFNRRARCPRASTSSRSGSRRREARGHDTARSSATTRRWSSGLEAADAAGEGGHRASR